MALRIALTGGGTGGHIYPCLALAEVLRENGAEIFYIGNHNKLEGKLLDPESSERRDEYDYIKFLAIEAKPLPRSKNPFKWLKWFWDFSIETNKVKEYIRDNQIDLIFGTGGYVAGPVFGAATLMKAPYIIHNLDANMGLANRFFVKDASALTLAFPIETIKPRNGNVFIVGNPISKKFLVNQETLKLNDTDALRESFSNRLEERNEQSQENGERKILITGGSQGAESINRAIGKILPQLTSKSKVHITHITGPKVYDSYVEEFIGENTYSNYTLLPYSHEMDKLCLEADIAICRAGAMTIAEMAASSTVPIFVPLAWAANDHQNANAKALVEANAAFTIQQDKLTEEEFEKELHNRVLQLIVDDELLYNMKNNLKAFSRGNSAEEIYSLIETILSR